MMTEWIIIISLILAGIVLILVEIIFIPGTTVIGILGILAGSYGVYMGYNTFGNSTGHMILFGSLVAALAVTVFAFRSGSWKRFALEGSIKSKVNENLTAQLKVGKEGVTVSSLKPIGKALFDDKEYEVTSLGAFIEEKSPVKIIKIDRNKIIVELNNAKIILANEVTKLCHGEVASKTAAATALETFKGAGISANLPTFEVSKNGLKDGFAAFDLFSQAGLATSNGEARRLIKGNGARLNDITITDETQLITSKDKNKENVIKLSAGKKRHILIREID